MSGATYTLATGTEGQQYGGRMPRPYDDHPSLPMIRGRILARPTVQQAAIALIYEASRSAWQERDREEIGSYERHQNNALIRRLVADLRQRRMRLHRGIVLSSRQAERWSERRRREG